MKIRFIFDRATKGTFRFTEDSEDPKIGTLYLKKSAAKELGVKEGQALLVTVEMEEK